MKLNQEDEQILKGLFSFMKQFPTEEAITEFIINEKFGGKLSCPYCGNERLNYYIKTRKKYQCSSRDCKRQFSLTTNTMMEGSRQSLLQWWWAIYFMINSKMGISSHALAGHLEIPQQTAWLMAQKIRLVMGSHADNILLGMDGRIVEIDEVYPSPDAGKRKSVYYKKKRLEDKEDEILGYNKAKRQKLFGKSKPGIKKGHNAEVRLKNKLKQDVLDKTVVYANGYSAILGMKERGGPVIFKKLGSTDRSVTKKRVLPHIIQHVSLDAKIMTDEAGVYSSVKLIYDSHRVCNHKKKKYVEKDDVWTNGIENSFKYVRNYLYGIMIRGVNFKHVELYLNEFQFRRNFQGQSVNDKFWALVPYILSKKKLMSDEIGDKNDTWIAAA